VRLEELELKVSVIDSYSHFIIIIIQALFLFYYYLLYIWTS